MSSVISINGKTIQVNRGTISIIDGKVLIGGKDISDLKEIEEKEINITIEGSVEKLEIDYCAKVQVNGNAQNVKTASGDVNVSGDVLGNIQTMSGDVDCGNVGGGVSTMSGDISHK